MALTQVKMVTCLQSISEVEIIELIIKKNKTKYGDACSPEKTICTLVSPTIFLVFVVGCWSVAVALTLVKIVICSLTIAFLVNLCRSNNFD